MSSNIKSTQGNISFVREEIIEKHATLIGFDGILKGGPFKYFLFSPVKVDIAWFSPIPASKTETLLNTF